MRSVAVCDEKPYEMNKCLSLVYLTANWLTEVFARDLLPVARKATRSRLALRLVGTGSYRNLDYF